MDSAPLTGETHSSIVERLGIDPFLTEQEVFEITGIAVKRGTHRFLASDRPRSGCRVNPIRWTLLDRDTRLAVAGYRTTGRRGLRDRGVLFGQLAAIR